MRLKANVAWLPVMFMLLVVSCIPQKETLYLQDKEPDMEFGELDQITGKYILQPNDYLYIRVSTFDPKISEFFNMQQGNINSSQMGNNTMFMYMIDDEMNIDFPYAGKINLKGCNLPKAKEKIKEELKPFIKDANLIVQLGTKSYVILGEVKSPGEKTMKKDQMTIFEAIGAAGDLTVFGKKREVKIVRQQPDGTTKTLEVDLTDHRIIGSEYYYIYPNDLIYVRPMRAKQFGIGESFSLGVLSSLLAFTLNNFNAYQVIKTHTNPHMQNNTPQNQNQDNSSAFSLDYKKLLRDLMKFWWLFLITIPLAISSVYVMHRYTTNIYSASMRILMEERGANTQQSDMMEGFGLTPGMRNVDNQLAVLSSWDMIRKAVNRLDFNVSYFVKGNFKTTEIYPASALKVEFDTLHVQLTNTPFYVKQINDKQFELSYTTNGAGAYNYSNGYSEGGVGFQEYRKVFEFGDWVQTKWFKFRVVCNNCKLLDDQLYYFVFNHPNTVTSRYAGLLRSFRNSESSIVSLSVTGDNKAKNVRFLNTLAEVFIESNLEKKNKIATNTIHFIESQLVNIKDSLSLTGTELSNFRTSNRIQSISSKAEYLFGRLQSAEQKLAGIEITKNYYQYLKAYFNGENISDDIVAPAIYQVDNQLIAGQIQSIMELNTERLAVKIPLGENENPYSGQKDMEFELAKNTLLKTIENQEGALKEEAARIIEEKKKFEEDLYSLPETERKLLGIERRFDLNNEVFTFLLRKRSEAQIQKASNTPDHQVLEAARSGGMVSPNIKGNYQKALFAGILLPLLFLVLRQLLNNKITTVEDVKKLTTIPIIGQIIHSNKAETNVVNYHPKSVVTETFRRVRTRLEFFVSEVESPVITVTSSMPGEGKNFLFA